MSESNANIDYSGLSENEAEEKFAAVEKQIAQMEDKRQTQTKEFVALLREKLGLSERLKKYQEVNNCEMRIRFIEARMRGEDMPHTEYVNLERKERRKRRNKTNTMMLVLVAIFVMMLGAVPMLKVMMDRVSERGEQIENVEANTNTTVVAPNTTPAATAPPVVTQAATPEPTTAPATSTAAAAPAEASIEEINETSGGKALDLKAILKPGRTTLFFFHSTHCPDCIIQIKKYKQLAGMYPEFKFYTVDVDRPFSDGIDRDSPVCQQFNINHFPYYMVYVGTSQAAVSTAAAQKMQEWYMARAPK